MNIDSALRMIDNEISNFRAKLKCKLAWCCQALGEVTAQDREGGGGGGVGGGGVGRREGRGGEEGQAGSQRLQWWRGCLEDVNNDHTDSGRTGTHSQLLLL